MKKDQTLLAQDEGEGWTLTVKNSLEEMAKLPGYVDSLGEALQLTVRDAMSIRLALEESLLNAIKYAYPKNETGKITVKATYNPTQSAIHFELSDNGKPFDPTQVPYAKPKLGIDEMPIGGLGIFLMRKHVDKVTYRREDGKNRLIMTKTIKNNKIWKE